MHRQAGGCLGDLQRIDGQIFRPDHRRNAHNYLNDLRCEMWGMFLTEDISRFVEETELSGEAYTDLYKDLSRKLAAFIGGTNHPQGVQEYIQRVSEVMLVWSEVCESIIGAPAPATVRN